MNQVNTMQEYTNLLFQTIEKTKQYIIAFPDLNIYKNLLQQLEFVKKIIIDERRRPNFTEVESTYIGSIAIKNLDDDPIYAEILKKISFVFTENKKIDFLNSYLK